MGEFVYLCVYCMCVCVFVMCVVGGAYRSVLAYSSGVNGSYLQFYGSVPETRGLQFE